MGKTKGKTTSKVKLSNKSTNKRMNASRRHKLNKSANKSKIINLPAPVKNRKIQQNLKSRFIHSEEGSSKEVENLDEHADEEVSDDEMADFINNSGNNLSFLSVDFNTSQNDNDRKRKSVDDVAEYEKIPRMLSKVSLSEQEESKKIYLLPIKGKQGVIKRTGKKPDQPASDTDAAVENGIKDTEIVKEIEPISFVELLAQRKSDLNAKKLKIAQFSQDIVENPEANITLMKQLLNFCNKTEATCIRKLSMLSLLEIFKDIIPSYRIRELTVEEKSAKVSKDVRKVRDFEETLLSNYQKYLQLLEESISDCTKLLKKKHKNGDTIQALEKALKGIAIVAVKCLTQLLQNVSHFNFRGNIITVIVPGIEMEGEMNEAGKLCADAIHTLFRADNTGEISLEIIKVIHRLVKSKNNVKPMVLETLLSLRINADAIQGALSRGNKIERLKEKREAIRKMSKKERKRKKMEDELSKELQEVEAVESNTKIERLQTDVLKLLFVTYFRILKSNSATPLLKPVLKGLSKFAHLINVEFFDDLMTCLQRLLQSGMLGNGEKLSCILTALKILSGQGEALNIDPRQFYTELYNVLPYLSTDFNPDDGDLLQHCLDVMILKRRKQISLPQVHAFFKRISTVLLQVNTDQLFAYIILVRNILQLHKKCDYLLDNEDFGRGIFQQDAVDPEHSNAEGTSLWEMVLLWKHYHPHTVTYVNHILNGAPSQGSGALPAKYLLRNDKQPSGEKDLSEYFLDEISEKPKKSKMVKTIEDYHSNQLSDIIQHELNIVDKLERRFYANTS